MSLRELRRHVGRLAVVGFSGESVPGDLRRLASEFDLAGVVYFARNVVEPRQLAELSREVADLAIAWPLWISVDQEGGRVARLGRRSRSGRALGRGAADSLAERYAHLATELAPSESRWTGRPFSTSIQTRKPAIVIVPCRTISSEGLAPRSCTLQRSARRAANTPGLAIRASTSRSTARG
jgi:hypothetical protein